MLATGHQFHIMRSHANGQETQPGPGRFGAFNEIFLDEEKYYNNCLEAAARFYQKVKHAINLFRRLTLLIEVSF